jgi:hypothetical protein
MRQAITTKYHGPTDSRGSRISATAMAGKLFISYDYGNEDQHHRAACALARKLEWYGTWVAGGLPDGKGNCYSMREVGPAARAKHRARKLVKIEG